MQIVPEVSNPSPIQLFSLESTLKLYVRDLSVARGVNFNIKWI